MSVRKLRERIEKKSPPANSSSDQQQNGKQLDLLKLFGVKISVESTRAVDVLVPLNQTPKKGPNVFFVHSIEGTASTLESVGRQIDYPTFCLQCVENAPLDSIESLAAFYVKVKSRKTYKIYQNHFASFQNLKAKQPHGPYHIVGYSYGANVAFEMAYQLLQADQNSIGSLTLIDASHLYWQAYRELYRKSYHLDADDLSNNALFETELLCAVTMRYINIDYKRLREELLQLDSWKTRVNHAVNKLISNNNQLQNDRQVLEYAANALVDKFKAADKYRPQEKKQKFAGKVTLIRAENGALKTSEYGEDYGLKQVFK